MVQIIITGAAGRMGMRLIALTLATPGLQLYAAVEAENHPALGKDAGEVAQIGQMNIPITDNLNTCLSHGDVVIDFTAPSSCLANLRKWLNLPKPWLLEPRDFPNKN